MSRDLTSSGSVSVDITTPGQVKLNVALAATSPLSYDSVTGTVSLGSAITATYGGFGSDISAQSGVPLFATGVPTFTSTSGTGNFVRVTSPTLVTPVLGAATATTLAIGGAAIGSDALAVTGSASISGAIVGAGNLSLGAANTFAFTGRGAIQSPTTGFLTVLNNVTPGAIQLNLGGATSSFPAIKRSTTAVQFRLADDSGDAPISASTVTASTSVGISGSSSGGVTLAARAAAGTPTVTFGTSTGTPAVTATAPLVINSTTGNITASAATDTASGVVELATDAETQTGTDTARAITPANLTARSATTSRTGIVELATDAETIALSSTSLAVTPSNLAALLATDVQTFTSSGTWTKPDHGKLALVQIIGAAGGGARRATGNGSGGGGGSYFERLYLLAALGATETVTIGTGGAVQSTDNTDGNAGGTTSFGSQITVYGGRGGSQVAAGTAVNGGGSATHYDIWTAGAAFSVGVTSGVATNNSIGSITISSFWGVCATGASAANAVQTLQFTAFQGGAGGAGHSSTGPVSGLASTTQNGGNGGAGNGAGAGGNGSSPGGGGGSGTTQGGSGGNGRIIVTVFG